MPEDNNERRSYDAQIAALHDDVIELTAKHHELKAHIDAKLNNGIKHRLDEITENVSKNTDQIEKLTDKFDRHLSGEDEVISGLKDVVAFFKGLRKIGIVVAGLAGGITGIYAAWEVIKPLIGG